MTDLETTSQAPWVLPLSAAENSLAVAGGKGANLARMVRAGLPVPGGFVVTTAAYRAYVAANPGLAATIRSAVEGLAADDPTGLEAASAQIWAGFAAGSLPSALDEALRRAYGELGRPAVAVRSSATAEDLPELSFAGQQDTYLNVAGEEALLQAVAGCWSSLWTARAIGYRQRQAIGQDGLALAVVVQEMVEAEAAGVLFTANPLNGKRTEMAVEATLGLGEALVSGRVEPDRYLLEAASGRVVERCLGRKALSIRGQPGGGTVEQAEEDAADRPALPDTALAELAGHGRRLAELLGGPQDVEWAWAGGTISLLQSRPITALYPVPEGLGPQPLRVLFSFGSVQGILAPITPLGRSTAGAIFAGGSRLFGYHLTAETQRAMYTAGERLFIDFTGLARHRSLRRLLRAGLALIDPGAAAALETLWDDPRLAPREGFGPATMRRLLPFLARVMPRMLLSLLRPDAARRRFQAQLDEAAVAHEARMAAAETLVERVALARQMMTGAFAFALPRFVPRFAAAMGPLNLLNHLAAGLPEGQALALALTRGLPHNVTTEMDLALWQAARQIGGDAAAAAHFAATAPEALAAEYQAGRLPAAAQAALSDFLERYGMRGLGEIDLGRPRWREAPAPVMRTLKSYLAIDDPALAPDAVFRRGETEAHEAIERLVGGLRETPRGRLKARVARWAARRVRALAGLRESPKFWAVRVMGATRAALLDSGRALVEAGRLARPDDLFFLELTELEALAAGEARDWPALVEARRDAYTREMDRRQVPRLLLSDGQAFYEGVAAPAGEAAGELSGSPVSAGVVEGIVHVVLDPHQAQLAPGEILVCPGTDPAWTPLFLVAGGLVTEVGGLMTHGSVVAREYGIPAVVGVSRATHRLQTGQRVRVDGTAGRITILDSTVVF